MKFMQVATTTDTREKAEEIARLLVEDGLAACVQIDGPITSIYHWQGKVEEAKEWRLTAKSRYIFFEDIAEAIRSAHTYEVPEIVATEIVRLDESYQDWLEQETIPGER